MAMVPISRSRVTLTAVRIAGGMTSRIAGMAGAMAFRLSKLGL
jgi:hypothetical protein